MTAEQNSRGTVTVPLHSVLLMLIHLLLPEKICISILTGTATTYGADAENSPFKAVCKWS